MMMTKAFIICFSLGLSLSVFAAERVQLKLFHDPRDNTLLEEPEQHGPGLEKTEPGKVLPEPRPMPNKADARSLIRVLYNGFISSAQGDYFFINGKRLTGMDDYKLLSVSEGGRLLELETRTGKRFRISIGQSLSFKRL